MMQLLCMPGRVGWMILNLWHAIIAWAVLDQAILAIYWNIVPTILDTVPHSGSPLPVFPVISKLLSQANLIVFRPTCNFFLPHYLNFHYCWYQSHAHILKDLIYEPPELEHLLSWMISHNTGMENSYCNTSLTFATSWLHAHQKFAFISSVLFPTYHNGVQL